MKLDVGQLEQWRERPIVWRALWIARVRIRITRALRTVAMIVVLPVAMARGFLRGFNSARTHGRR